MDFNLQYFLSANLILLMVALFYRALLARLPQFHWNRFFLLTGSVAAFIIPLIEWPAAQGPMSGFSFSSALPEAVVTSGGMAISGGFSWLDLAMLAYLSIAALVAVIFLIRTGRTLVEIWRAPQEKGPGYTLVRLSSVKGPASFFQYLIWDGDLDQQPEKAAFIRAHEECHIRQLHSLDLVLMEVLSALCWFNPAIYLLRTDLKRTHEYLADQAAVDAAGHNPLRKIILEGQFGTTGFPVVNHFQSQIKARLMMSESSRKPRQLFRYLLILPMALFVIACSGVESQVPDSNELASKAAPGETMDPVDKPLDPAAADFSGENVEMPAPTNLAEVVEAIGYPDELKEEGIEAKVMVRVKVNPEGDVVEHSVVKEGHPTMRQAVEKHLYDLKFSPGQKDGKPVTVWVTIPFAFKMG
jgi:TonB family protein